ncbi:mitochondrial fission regulator 1 [Abrus precatorius]|uniref:Mitochondrial fission regulator 1 n=1 Tax=Abrus precatorius TaxID=3816 RepID=A0A8B8L5B8_ABRPR|nr:mitochondrial fission regulator 1 [Abrus precatorius]
MGEVHVQSHQYNDHSPTPTTITTPQKQKQPIIPNTTSSMYDHQEQQQHNDHSVLEPTDLFSMMHLNNPSHHRHPPCTTVNNSMKRRSPPSSSSSGQPSAKKLFCDQEDLILHGFSAIPIPLNLNSLVSKTPSFPVLRRCVSDPYTPPPPPPPQPRGSGLPPLPPTLRRSVSDLSPSSDKAFSRSSASEETATAPEYMRLRRMKDRLKEMRQWWDEVIKEEEEGEECAVREDDKVPSQDELGGEDCEEAVNVEWAEKCLSLAFRCPCGKGYEVLLSENNCYYKLV